MLTIEQCRKHVKSLNQGYDNGTVYENRMDFIRPNDYKNHYVILSIYYNGRMTFSHYDGINVLPYKVNESSLLSASNNPKRIVQTSTVRKVITVTLSYDEFDDIDTSDLDYASEITLNTLSKVNNTLVQSILDNANKAGIDFVIFHSANIVRD